MRRASTSRRTDPNMQGRHFWWIADVIRDLPEREKMSRWDVAIAFAGACRMSNGRFKWDYFMKACEATEPVTPEPRKRVKPIDHVKTRFKRLELDHG